MMIIKHVTPPRSSVRTQVNSRPLRTHGGHFPQMRCQKKIWNLTKSLIAC